MSNDESIIKIYNDYKIKLSIIFDYINIKIEKNFYSYESNFNIEYLQKFKLLISNLTINEMIEFINGLIDENNIKIEENENNLKLILISTLFNHPNVELILNKNLKISNEIIEKLINEISNIKNENKILKENYNKLNKRIELIEKENERLKKENIKNGKRIDFLEKFHNNKIQLTECDLHNINTIQVHNNSVCSMSIFPSGNIISVSKDQSIKIYDINFDIIQCIENAHDDTITFVEIKDEKNFITCSKDKIIKLWIKNQNQYIINKLINNAHDDVIMKIIYISNGNLISCSLDNTIKIWKESNNNYEKIITLTHSNKIYSILYLEYKNLLISSGLDGTKFWNLNKNEIKNINCIKHFEETFCGWNEGLCKLDEDRIIVNGKKGNSLKIISISNKVIIKEINNPFQSLCIKIIENKGIFIVGGLSKDIRIYRQDNYECIQTIQNAHENNILGFIGLKDKTIASFSDDKKIKIWDF